MGCFESDEDFVLILYGGGGVPGGVVSSSKSNSKKKSVLKFLFLKNQKKYNSNILCESTHQTCLNHENEYAALAMTQHDDEVKCYSVDSL